MGIHITAYQTRDTDESITFLNADGTQGVIASGDKVRIKVGRQLGTPSFDIVSGTPLSGSTQVNAANPATLKLYKADLANLKPGVYDIEAAVVDASDSSRIKFAEFGVFVLIGTQGGGTT